MNRREAKPSLQTLLSREVIFVSGKGGTGKSTVAAALALAATRAGRRVLLAEVEGRGELVRTLGIEDPGFDERETPWGFRVLSITPRAAAVEYLHLFVGMDLVTGPILRTGVLDQLTGSAPGFRDVLTCGKLYEIARVRRRHRRERGRPLYDLIVVDSPPTGQIGPFLEGPATYAALVRVGSVQRQLVAIRRFLRERAGVVLVSTLEEMSVAETVEAIPALARSRMPVLAIVANRATPSLVPRGAARAFSRLTAEALRDAAEDRGVTMGSADAERLLLAARSAQARHVGQSPFLAELRRTSLPTLVVPEAFAQEPPALAEAVAEAVSGRSGPARHPARHHGDGARPSPARAIPVPSSLMPGGIGPSLRGAHVVVVCGSGGVGKTTISAALAVHFAARGRRTILLTVDPARRLGTALRLPMAAGNRTMVPVGGGRKLEALQLDTQRTFDELVNRHAGSPERRDRILDNRFYQRIADTLSGTHEYMAMEKLYELAAEEDHEVIVIDTPPTRSALSFLDAPARVTDFLGGRLLRWMAWPSARVGRLSLSMARFGATAFAATAGRLVGARTLTDLAEFLRAFEGMYDGFKERAAEVAKLMRARECSFVIVAAPSEPGLHEATYFAKRLADAGMRTAAVVANRWHLELPPVPEKLAEAAALLSAGSVQERALGAVLEGSVRAGPRLAAQAAAMATFASENPEVPILPVPELAGDVHDLKGLRMVARQLFAEEAGAGVE